ncbi:posphoenolpyruvate synthetase regulatory kinase/phosphorylase PpsR [Kaarinaea lacus]
MTRKAFFVSDSTGITAETFGHSLLSQFDAIEFDIVRLRYIDTEAKALEAKQRIASSIREATRPLVFSTLVDPALRRIIADSGGIWFDLFETYIGPLQQELQLHPSHAAGRTHGVLDDRNYTSRIDAVNYALRNDDGASMQHYNEADIILIGVSRTGKTPTCLYLALHYGIFAANYPLTEDEQFNIRLPAGLLHYRQKLFGLTINPERLQRIREQRQPGSQYASLSQCRTEVRQAESLFAGSRIDYLDTTTMSVEEIATSIMKLRSLDARRPPLHDSDRA